MKIWQSRYDAASRTHHHVMRGKGGHAVLAQVAAYTFKALRISTAIFDGNLWWPIHVERGVSDFEPEHGRDGERVAYNDRMITEVVRRRAIVRGEHAGYSDLFVPLGSRGVLFGVLVAGPFARAPPKVSDLHDRWRWLSGKTPALGDPGFAAYMEATFATLVLEGKRAQLFERMLERVARLLSGEGDAAALLNEADVLRAELEQGRAVDRAWDAVASMVDERYDRRWRGANLAWTLGDLGLERLPDAVLVGLSARRGSDPIDDAIRRDALQRRSVDLARGFGRAIAGRVGAHGVVILSSANGTVDRRRRALLDLSARVEAAARRLGLGVHFGACVSDASAPLSRAYEYALSAAQSALTLNTRFVVADVGADRSGSSLRQLREELGRAVEQDPEKSGARFDRYLEAVARHSGYRMEAAGAHLEVGFDRMADALIHCGALEPKGVSHLRSSLDRAAAEAGTMEDLFDAYRRAAGDMARAVLEPVAARHERSLRGALEFISDHFAERLPLGRVARVAGLSPTYFSEVFKKRQGITFERHLADLRVERARQLLSATQLSVTRVAEISGYRSLQYFGRVFQRMVGMTPREYRRRTSRLIKAKQKPKTMHKP